MKGKIFIILSILLSFTICGKSYKSPYELNYHIDIPILTISGTLSIAPMLFAPKVSYQNSDTYKISDLNWLDKQGVNNYDNSVAKLSDYLYGGMLLSYFGLNLINTEYGDYFTEITIMAETVLINTALVNIFKYSVKRPRPYVYSGKGSKEQLSSSDSRVSFYSGHTSNSFALSVAFATMFSPKFDQTWQKVLIWSVPLTISTFIGYLRVRAGRHFYSDVLTGMAVGSALGYLIPYLHKKKGGSVMVGADKKYTFIGYSGTF